MLYPSGADVGPDQGEDARVLDARNTGRARVDDVPGGSQILVPVSRGGTSGLPSQTPVIRVVVEEPGITSAVGLAWGLLALLGLTLLVGSLVVVDRLGRSFVQPIRRLAEHTQTLGSSAAITPVPDATGRRRSGSSPARSTGSSAGSSCSCRASARTSPTCPTGSAPRVTALRLRVEPSPSRTCANASAGDLDSLQATVDEIVREARRSEREGLDPQRSPGATDLASSRSLCGPAAPTSRRWSTCSSTTSSPTLPTCW